MKLGLFCLLTFNSCLIHAGILESLKLRDKIKIYSSRSIPDVFETLKLRTTRGIDQEDSLYCWAFSAANLLETSYLEKHPDVKAKNIELSRWYIENALPNRWILGTSLDAIYTFSTQVGYVMNSEYSKGSLKTLKYTQFLDKKITPLQLRDLLVGDKVFWSYAISESRQGWGEHLDPDSTDGKKSFYISRKELPRLIKKALTSKEALAFWYDEHVVTLYGADFDKNGKAVKYYIKDSYWPYFYESSAEKTHEIIIEFTAIANLNSTN